MKKKSLISFLSILVIFAVTAVAITLTNKSVVAEKTVNSERLSVENKEMGMNPTIAQAIKRAKENPDFWESENEFDDSVTILAVHGGFLKGKMKDEQTNTVFNSDTDPDAATLGEIRAAIAESTN